MEFRFFGSGDALVMTRHLRHAQMDRIILKQLMVRSVAVVQHGVEGVEFIRRKKVSFVILDTELADMSACEFMNKLKQEKLIFKAPLVVVTADNRRQTVLNAISHGCSGYILRPYSPSTFEAHLKKALSSVRYDQATKVKLMKAKANATKGDHDEAIKNLQDIAKVKNNSKRFADAGAKFLMKGRYEEAIIAFNEALKRNRLFAEAYEGLAEAYKAKGMEEESRKHLQMAADVYAVQDRYEETKRTFIEVLKKDPKAANPYNKVGMRLKKKGDYEGALQAYFQGQRLSPDDEHLLYNIANAYAHKGDRRASLDYVSEALKINSDFPKALQLYKKLSGHDYQP